MSKMKRYYIIAIIAFPLSFVVGLLLTRVVGVQSQLIGTVVTIVTLIVFIMIGLKISDKYWGEQRFDFEEDEETVSDEELAKQIIAHSIENLDHEKLANTNVYWSEEQERFIIEKKEKQNQEL